VAAEAGEEEAEEETEKEAAGAEAAAEEAGADEEEEEEEEWGQRHAAMRTREREARRSGWAREKREVGKGHRGARETW
jgi:hypothetical protein